MPDKRIFRSVADFVAAVGDQLPPSDWVEINQDRIDLFADATGDHQWIHVDTERAASGPFGKTIAHGFLTLSLIPVLMKGSYDVEGHTMGLNYGLDKVRFPAPVPVGSRLRAQLQVQAAEETSAGAVQITWLATIECEGADRPVCIAQMITRYAF